MNTRGLLREGYAADVVVFDPERMAPMMPELVYDLPAGARRLQQKSAGITATVVNGDVLMRDHEHTGALPGQLIRGPLAAKSWRRQPIDGSDRLAVWPTPLQASCQPKTRGRVLQNHHRAPGTVVVQDLTLSRF